MKGERVENPRSAAPEHGQLQGVLGLTTKPRRISSALAATAALMVVTGPSTATARPALPSPWTDPVPDSVPARPAAASAAQVVLSRMSLAQRVGQLFMVGTEANAADRATLSQISRYHVGNV